MTLRPTQVWVARMGLLLTAGFFTALMLLSLVVFRPALTTGGHILLGAETLAMLAFVIVGVAPIGFQPSAQQREALKNEIAVAAIAAMIVSGALVRLTMAVFHG